MLRPRFGQMADHGAGSTDSPAKPQGRLSDRVLGGLLWQFSGTVGRGLLQIGFLTVLARLITPEEFGLVGAALIVVNLSSLFSQLGVGPALIHRPSLSPNHIGAAMSITLLLSMASVGIVWAAAIPIAAFFRMPGLVQVLRVLAFVFVLKGFSTVAESLARRDLAFKELAGIDVASYTIGYGIVGTALAVLGLGYWALVFAHIGQSLLQASLLLIVRPHRLLPSADYTAARELLEYGLGETLFSLANYAAVQGDNVLVGRILGPAALGIYGRAYQLLVTPARLFGAVLDRVLFPSMAKLRSDSSRLARTYIMGLGAVALTAIPTSGLVLVLAPEIVETLLGSAWTGVVAPLRIFSLAILFRTSYKISHSLARATGRVYKSASREGAYAAVVVVGAWVGAHWGVTGVAAGALVAVVFEFAVFTHLGMRTTGLQYSDIVSAHVPGFRLGTVVSVVAYCVATGLRMTDMPAAAVLGGTGFVVAVSVGLGLVRRWPSAFLGRDGIWMYGRLLDTLPPAVSSFLRTIHPWVAR